MSRDVLEIFSEAAEIADSAERAAFLATACGDDTALRRKVEELLTTHQDLGENHGFLGGTVQLVDEGLDRALASVLPLAERHVVGAADELQEELRAVGRAFITDSGQRGPEPSGQGHLGESARLVGAPGARRADEHDRTDEDGVEYGKTPSADQGPPCSPLFCTSGGKKRS